MRKWIFVAFATVSMLSGCSSDTDGGSPPQEDNLDEGGLVKEITDRWNARPRSYSSLVDGSNATEKRFLKAVTAGRIAAVAKANRFAAFKGTLTRFNDSFVATSTLLEGLAPHMVNQIDDERMNKIGTFTSVGVDFHEDTLPTWLDWSPPYFKKTWDARNRGWGKNSQTYDGTYWNDDGDLVFRENEKHEIVLDFYNANIEDAVGTSAAIFAMMLAQALSDSAALKKAGPLAQYYWATYYYNAGVAAGRKALTSRGACNYRKDPVADPGHNRSAAFNAQMRTATFELVSRQAYKVSLAKLEEGC